MTDPKEKNAEEINQDIVNLVVARLNTMPPRVAVSIGSEGSFSVSDLIDRVRKGDDVGKKMIEVQLAYLRSLQKLSAMEHVPASH